MIANKFIFVVPRSRKMLAGVLTKTIAGQKPPAVRFFISILSPMVSNLTPMAEQRYRVHYTLDQVRARLLPQLSSGAGYLYRPPH